MLFDRIRYKEKLALNHGHRKIIRAKVSLLRILSLHLKIFSFLTAKSGVDGNGLKIKKKKMGKVQVCTKLP